jgi:hypothetical protein
MTVASHNCNCTDSAGVTYRSLATLRGLLMRRLGFGNQLANPPPGMAELCDSFLADANTLLFNRFTSLRGSRFFSWDLEEGVNLYDVADNVEQTAEPPCTKILDVNKLEWVGIIRPGNLWVPLRAGIPPELNSYEAASGYPVRYEIRQCIEVWPAPAATEGQLVIKGNFGLLPFAADDDVPSVDDTLVFLLALGNAKAHYRQPDAGNYVQQGEILLNNLVAGTHQPGHNYIPGERGARRRIYVEPVPTVPFPG